MSPLSFEGFEILLQINLSALQHPAHCDKGHTIFYSNHPPGLWMPNALPYNCMTKEQHKAESASQGPDIYWRWNCSSAPWSMSCFSQVVFNHTPIRVTTIAYFCICGSTHHHADNYVYICAHASCCTMEHELWRLGLGLYLTYRSQGLPRRRYSSHV